MADTPRRKRKAKASAQAPATPLVLSKDVPQLRPLANIIVDADEVHLMMACLNAAIVVAASDSDDDDPDVQSAVDGAMMFLDNTPVHVTEGLITKLNRAHTATCENAQKEFEGLST